ncbi:MAG: hypothetical protein HY928_11085 [Elusimicrobia bacterium]|nr:hypothetical protein [Elusimicrobiota bacterium]
MRRLLPLLAAALLAARAEASDPARPLLFVPDQAALDWAALRSLAADARAAFSLALAPAATPEGERPWLREAVQAGRLELCLRLSGDPFLPIMAPARPGALAERLALEKALFRAAFGADPACFVAAGAAPGKEGLEAIAAGGFAWTAAGAGAFSRAWTAAGALKAVPFAAAASTAAAREPEPGATPGVAVDESVTLAPGSGLAVLKGLLGASAWSTGAGAAKDEGAFGISPSEWPAWEGSAAWASAPDGKAARRTYSLAADALERYQNSGTASVRSLERGAEALDAGAAVRHFRPGAPLEALVAALAPAFKASGEAVPEADGTPGEGTVLAAPLAGGVAFEGPTPVSTASWVPRSLKVERVEGDLLFTIGLNGFSPDPSAALGFSGLTVELYIDVNGLAGRGSTRLLGGRRHLIASKDAWEFAVVVTPAEGALWRVGTPNASRLAAVAVEADPPALKVRVPAARLRGQPSSWGYLLLTAPEGSDQPQGILAATQDQKLLGAEGTPPVLRALRLVAR